MSEDNPTGRNVTNDLRTENAGSVAPTPERRRATLAGYVVATSFGAMLGLWTWVLVTTFFGGPSAHPLLLTPWDLAPHVAAGVIVGLFCIDRLAAGGSPMWVTLCAYELGIFVVIVLGYSFGAARLENAYEWFTSVLTAWVIVSIITPFLWPILLVLPSTLLFVFLLRRFLRRIPEMTAPAGTRRRRGARDPMNLS